MLLTITCEGPHAKDFGFLLYKNPASVFERDLAFGRLTVFYTENEPRRATVALLCEVDPVSLVRGGNRAAALDQYVNDRPYVASSLTSVALRTAFSSALGGKSKERPELVGEQLPLRARVPAVHARGGQAIVEKLFRPLGYAVSVTPSPITRHPSPSSELLSFEIAGSQTVHDLLSHLYVLIPVLDAAKHYFIGEDEVEKLLEHGSGWLANHPEKLLITNRYLKFRRGLVGEALSQLTVGQTEEDVAEQEAEARLEEQVRLHEQRIDAVVGALENASPPLRRIVDMGCGEGRLLQALLANRTFNLEDLVGVDISTSMLAIAEKRLDGERLPAAVRDRVKLLQGSVLYRDRRLEGYDAVTLVEVIEHIEEDRLDVVRTVLFEHLRPRRVVITTPNVEYNARFGALPAGDLRHADHRFEWTRDQFRAWCMGRVGGEGAAPHGYAVRFAGIGPSDPEVGAPTQMAVFDRDGQA